MKIILPRAMYLFMLAMILGSSMTVYGMKKDEVGQQGEAVKIELCTKALLFRFEKNESNTSEDPKKHFAQIPLDADNFFKDNNDGKTYVVLSGKNFATFPWHDAFGEAKDNLIKKSAIEDYEANMTFAQKKPKTAALLVSGISGAAVAVLCALFK